jgi:TonB family protein
MSDAAKQEPPLEGVITAPAWASRPSGDDVARFYPSLASTIRLPGRVEISCSVSTLGAVSNCAVIAEVPAGMGFGDAAISLSSLFRMKPRTLDGQPAPGGVVRIPIRFELATDDARARVEPAAPPPSASAMALGRRLAAAQNSAATTREMIENGVNQLRAQLGQVSPTHEQQLVLDAYREALTASAVAQAETNARGYAQALPEPELAKAVAFEESPTGQALVRANIALLRTQGADAAAQYNALWEEVRARLCRQIACLPSSPSGPSPQRAAPVAEGSAARTP